MPIHNYGRITGTYDKALVLGCGPSMAMLSRDNVDKAISAGVAVICVNRASYDFPCTHWVTHHPMEVKHPSNGSKTSIQCHMLCWGKRKPEYTCFGWNYLYTV